MSFWSNYDAAKGKAENTRLQRAQAFEQFRKSNPQASYQDWVDELNRITGGRPGTVVSSEDILRGQFEETQRVRRRQLYQERAQDLNTRLQLTKSVDGLIEQQALAQDNDAQVIDNVLRHYDNDPLIRDYIYQRYPKGFSGIRERNRLKIISDNKGLVVDALRRDEGADIASMFPYLKPEEVSSLRDSALEDIKKLDLADQSSNLNEELSRLNTIAASGDPEAVKSYEPILGLDGPALASFNTRKQATIARLQREADERTQLKEQQAEDRAYVLDERNDDEFQEEVAAMRDHYSNGAPGTYTPQFEMTPEQRRQFLALEVAALEDRRKAEIAFDREEVAHQRSEEDRVTRKINAAVDRFANSEEAKIILATPGMGRTELTAALMRGLESQGIDPQGLPRGQLDATVDMILGRAESQRSLEYGTFRDGYVGAHEGAFAKRNSQAAGILSEQLTNPDGPAGRYASSLSVVLPQIGANYDLVSDPTAMARVYELLTESALDDAGIDPNNPSEILRHVQEKSGLTPASRKSDQFKRELDMLPRDNTTFDEYMTGLQATTSNILSKVNETMMETFDKLSSIEDPIAALKQQENEILIQMESLERSVELAVKHRAAWLTERGSPWSEDAVDNHLGQALIDLSKLRAKIQQRREEMVKADRAALQKQDEQVRADRKRNEEVRTEEADQLWRDQLGEQMRRFQQFGNPERIYNTDDSF